MPEVILYRKDEGGGKRVAGCTMQDASCGLRAALNVIPRSRAGAEHQQAIEESASGV